MTEAMLWLGSSICALSGAILLLMALHGRPMRGEAFVGAHLATGPIALAFVAGAGLVLCAAPLASVTALVLLALLAPGAVVGLTFLPLAAYGGRRARLVKAAFPVVVASPFAIGHGATLHTALPWAGALVLAAIGAGGTWVLVEHPLRRLRGRLVHALGTTSREPSAWERDQADWQRGEWAKLPADAGVADLLPHSRSLAADVRAACHERLAARADLDAAIAAALLGPEPADALWYVAQVYPRSRQSFAAPLAELLARLRATWPERLRADTHERPWTGDLMPAFECAVAVMLAGGDVRAELRAWQTELQTMPKFASIAKELARWLKKAA